MATKKWWEEERDRAINTKSEEPEDVTVLESKNKWWEEERDRALKKDQQEPEVASGKKWWEEERDRALSGPSASTDIAVSTPTSPSAVPAEDKPLSPEEKANAINRGAFDSQVKVVTGEDGKPHAMLPDGTELTGTALQGWRSRRQLDKAKAIEQGIQKSNALAEGTDRWQNVIPQGIGEIGAGLVSTAGVVADTALEVPRRILSATLPEETYQSLYGAPSSVPFTGQTQATSQFAEDIKRTTDEMFPAPAANRELHAELARNTVVSSGEMESLIKDLTTYAANPVGTLQEIGKQATQFGVLGRALGAVGGAAALEAGQGYAAGEDFDRDWSTGQIQESAAFNALLQDMPEEQAKEVLRAQRQQVTTVLNGLTGATLQKLSHLWGGDLIERALKGEADAVMHVANIPAQALSEVVEEVPIQMSSNLSAQLTGSEDRPLMEGTGSAAAGGFAQGLGTAGGIAGVQTGLSAIREDRVSPPPTANGEALTAPINVDQSINQALQEGTPPAAAGAAKAREALASAGAVSTGEPAPTPKKPAARYNLTTGTWEQIPSKQEPTSKKKEEKPYVPATEEELKAKAEKAAQNHWTNRLKKNPEMLAAVRQNPQEGITQYNTLVEEHLQKLKKTEANKAARAEAQRVVESVAAQQAAQQPTTKQETPQEASQPLPTTTVQGTPQSVTQAVTEPSVPPTENQEVQSAPVANRPTSGVYIPKTNNLKDALNNIVTSRDTTEDERTVASELLKSPEIRKSLWTIHSSEDTNAPIDIGTAQGSTESIGRNVAVNPMEPVRTLLHEAQHAATVRAIAAVENGKDTNPANVAAVANLKTALGEFVKAVIPQSEVSADINYAKKNIFEMMAVIRSDPKVRDVLNKMGLTVETTVETKAKEKQTTKVPYEYRGVWGALTKIADYVLQLLGIRKGPRTRLATKEVDVLRKSIIKSLLTDVVTENARTLEQTSPPMMSPQQFTEGRKRIREQGAALNDAQLSADLEAVEPMAIGPTNAPSTVQTPEMPKQLTQTQKAAKTLKSAMTTLFNTVKMGTRAAQLGDISTFNMAENAKGIVNHKNILMSGYLRSVARVAKQTLGKRYGAYQESMVDALQGRQQRLPLPPKVADAIKNVRSMIDGMSMEMIALGIVKTKDIPKFLARVGKYTHRAYKAWELKPGEWRKIVAAEASGTRVKDLIPEIVKDIRLPSPDQLDTLLAVSQGGDRKSAKVASDALERMRYNYGVIDKPGYIEMLKDISREANKDPQAVVAWAYQLADRMLDPKTDSKRMPSPYRKPLSTDTTAVTKKVKDLPDWVRKLWGEFKEFDSIAINTTMAMAPIIAKWKSLLGYKQELLDKGVLKKGHTPPGYVELNDRDPMVYGPFNGYSIKEEDFQLLRAMTIGHGEVQALGVVDAAGNMISDAIKGPLENITKYFKVAQILGDASALFWNTTSSAYAMTLAAGYNILKAPKYVGPAASIVRAEALNNLPVVGVTPDKAKAEVLRAIQFLVEEQVLGDAALAVDARSELIDGVLSEAYARAPASQKFVKYTVPATYGKAVDVMSRLHSAGDSFAKLMIFFAKRDHLRAIYPNKTQEEVEKIAASETRDSMPTPSRAAPAARWISRYGLFATFATYSAEILRTMYKDTALGVGYVNKFLQMSEKDQKKPENLAMKRYGLSILAGNALRVGAIGALRTAIAGLASGAFMLYAMSGGDDDEDKEQKANLKDQIEKARKLYTENYDAVRTLMPEWVMGDVVLLRNTEGNTYTFFSTQRMDPYPINAAFAEAEAGRDAGRVAWRLVEGVAGLGFLGDPMYQALQGRDGAGERVAELAVPGTIRRGLLRPFITQPKKGLNLTPFETTIDSGLGLSVNAIDFNEAVVNEFKNAGFEIGESYKKLSKGLTIKRKSTSEVLTGRDDFQQDYTSLAETYRDVYDNMLPKVDAMRKLGFSDGEIMDLVRSNNAGVSQEFVDGLLNGSLYIPHPEEIIANSMSELKSTALSEEKQLEGEKYYDQLAQDGEALYNAAKTILKKGGYKIYGDQ